MSNFNTILPFTESLEDDYYLIRRPDGDAKISKKNLFSSIYPIGTCLLFGKDTSPSELGLVGKWSVIDAENGCIATVSNTDPNLGTTTGTTAVTIPLVEHTHTGSTTTNGAHTHNIQSSNVEVRASIGNYDEYGSHDIYEDCGAEADITQVTYSTTHTHTVSTSTVGVTEPMITTIIPQFKRVLLWVRES